MRQPGAGASTRGEPAAAAVLVKALAASDPDHDDELTHGFHAYPARMHFAVARTLLDALAGSNTRVLDPFCGSGTVLVEATLRGLPAMGVDLSPLALRIAEVKCERRDKEAIEVFQSTAMGVAERSAERVQGKVKVRAPLPASERQWYDPHVLLELGGLHAEIEALPQGADRRALEVVLSSIVVKFSRQRADTAEEMVQRTIRRGVPTDFFARKADELSQRWTALSARVGKDAPRVQLRSGDARQLTAAVGAKRRFDLVVSSPPYGGTYDYVDHHRRRRAWLGLDAKLLERGEIGARRRLSVQGGLRQWDDEMAAVLRSIRSTLSEPAQVVLLVGDGEAVERRVDALDQLETLAPPAGLRVVASASVPRPDWRGKDARSEHLVQLVPV